MWERTMQHDLLVMGAAGFLGREVVREGARAGLSVAALVRSPEQAAEAAAWGATAVVGDAAAIDTWMAAARGARVVVDLVQPRLPERLTRRTMRKLGRYRVEATQAVLRGLGALAESERPLLL